MPVDDVTPLTDIHTHVVTSAYVRYLQEAGEQAAAVTQLPWLAPFVGYTADRLVEDLDLAGVSHAWVSCPPPGVATDEPGRAFEHAGLLNEDLVREVSGNPTRLSAVPLIPLIEPSVASQVVQRYPRSPAAIVHLRPSGPQPDHPSFWPALECLEAAGIPIFLHPGVEPLSPLMAQWGLASAMSAPMLTSLTVMRLIHSGTLDAFPGLRIVVPHGGGVLPYLLVRLEDQSSGRAKHTIRDYLSRMTFDSACFDVRALRFSQSNLPDTAVALGSDAPFRGELRRAVATYVEVKVSA